MDRAPEKTTVELENALKGIKEKASHLESQTKYLVEFNERLETLLRCIEAYSFEESEPAEKKKENVEVLQIETEPVKKTRKIDKLQGLYGKNEIMKDVAINVFETIKLNEPIALDDLVGSIKYSRYKIMEVLNRLIREKVIVKSFEKGFVYRISKENQ